MRLTDQAQSAWREVLHPAAIAVDATAGNGHDTLFLARSIGPDGHVYAIDCQVKALKQTRVRLKAEGISADRVSCIRGNHAELAALLPPEVHGKVGLLCFNLGYLPGSNHRIRTNALTTSMALQQAAALLAPAGLLSVIAYRGHLGALLESMVVANFFSKLPATLRLHTRVETGNQENAGPVLWMARRTR